MAHAAGRQGQAPAIGLQGPQYRLALQHHIGGLAVPMGIGARGAQASSRLPVILQAGWIEYSVLPR